MDPRLGELEFKHLGSQPRDNYLPQAGGLPVRCLGFPEEEAEPEAGLQPLGLVGTLGIFLLLWLGPRDQHGGIAGPQPHGLLVADWEAQSGAFCIN